LGEVVFQKVIMKGIHLLFCRFGILRLKSLLLHQSCRRESSSCRKEWKWQKRIEKKKKDKQEEERRGVFVVSENRFEVAEFAKLSCRN
jgi:hypothetical protein